MEIRWLNAVPNAMATVIVQPDDLPVFMVFAKIHATALAVRLSSLVEI